jgi:hypothetical protein
MMNSISWGPGGSALNFYDTLCDQELGWPSFLVIGDENGLKSGRFWSSETEGRKLVVIEIAFW